MSKSGRTEGDSPSTSRAGQPASDWHLYDPAAKPPRKKVVLPPPPPWRRPGAQGRKAITDTFRPSAQTVEAVNVALYLRRPLLVTGKPGTGKSSLAYHIAAQLKLGEVLRWNIQSRSTLHDGLYQYDALARLQYIQQQHARTAGRARSGKALTARAAAQEAAQEAAELAQFLALGPLGRALASPSAPRVLLIDEIDKSDIDLPNDLLNVLDTGHFEIPELKRVAARLPVVTLPTGDDETVAVRGGEVAFTEFPVIVMTSNGERDFPAPFLRRCVQCVIAEPGPDELATIVAAHFGRADEQAQALIGRFLEARAAGALATDQLLNAQFLLRSGERRFDPAEEKQLLQTLFRSLD